jgi:chromosome segregation ATPase
MQNKVITVTMMSLACAAGVAMAQGAGASGSPAVQQKDRDRLLTSSPTLDQNQTLPAEVVQAMKDLTQAREQYQQQLRDQQQKLATCTDEQRSLLRDQLRDQIKDQAQDRDQLRDRLKELRDSVESHQALIDQAREQTRDRARRGE